MPYHLHIVYGYILAPVTAKLEINKDCKQTLKYSLLET